MTGYRLQVSALAQQFPRPGQQPLRVLDGLELAVRPGEFTAVIGPSGSGKSTLFNIIAGLDRPAAGQVLIDGAVTTGHSDQVAYMPQKDLLFPWRTIEDNAALGLEVQGVPRRAARAQVRPLFEEFGLDGFERSYPGQLSGGMRQRAALLRTVAMSRSVLLLDEPFGALDSLTRTQMQLWLSETWQRHAWTVLLVTHDIREAVFLADSVHVLSPRPAKLVRRVEIDLPRPRTTRTFLLPEFGSLEQQVLAALGLPPTTEGAEGNGPASAVPQDAAGPADGTGGARSDGNRDTEGDHDGHGDYRNRSEYGGYDGPMEKR